MAKELPYTPLEPTLVQTAINGSVTVVSTLYGPVDPERATRNRREIAHRAEQLNVTFHTQA